MRDLINRGMCHRVSDIPAQVPPLTPGTNKKMTEALEASFASWEKERVRLNITKGECRLFSFFLLSIYPNLAENIPSFFFSFLFFSLFFVPFSLCTFHGVQVSRRFLIILSLPRHGDLWRFRLEKHIFFFTYRFIDCLVRLCVSDFFFFSLLLVSVIFFFVNIYRSILK